MLEKTQMNSQIYTPVGKTVQFFQLDSFSLCMSFLLIPLWYPSNLSSKYLLIKKLQPRVIFKYKLFVRSLNEKITVF